MSRRRFHWNPETNQLEELPSDWAPTPRLEIAPDSHYDGLRATDGTDIGSRRKHREYMRQNGLTTADDFKETWAKAEKERERFDKGDFQMPGLRDTIGRAMYQRERRRK